MLQDLTSKVYAAIAEKVNVQIRMAATGNGRFRSILYPDFYANYQYRTEFKWCYV